MKKIMFNDEFLLTQAVLDGSKTQTRRLLTLTLHKQADRGNELIEVSPSKKSIEEAADYFGHLYPKVSVADVTTFRKDAFAAGAEEQPHHVKLRKRRCT